MPNSENQNQGNVDNNGNAVIKPEIGIEIDGISFNYKFFETLESLSKTYSQRKTAFPKKNRKGIESVSLCA